MVFSALITSTNFRRSSMSVSIRSRFSLFLFALGRQAAVGIFVIFIPNLTPTVLNSPGQHP
jgi:hypothetical protein